MIDVSDTIDGVLLYCDDRVASLNIGNGYIINRVEVFGQRDKRLAFDLPCVLILSIRFPVFLPYPLCLKSTNTKS